MSSPISRKIDDCRFDLCHAGTAAPTRREVGANLSFANGRKLSVRSQQHLLVRQVQVFSRHSFISRPHESTVPTIVSAISKRHPKTFRVPLLFPDSAALPHAAGGNPDRPPGELHYSQQVSLPLGSRQLFLGTRRRIELPLCDRPVGYRLVLRFLLSMALLQCDIVRDPEGPATKILRDRPNWRCRNRDRNTPWTTSPRRVRVFQTRAHNEAVDCEVAQTAPLLRAQFSKTFAESAALVAVAKINSLVESVDDILWAL